MCARRTGLLKNLQDELSGRSYIKKIDISQPYTAVRLLEDFINQMGGVDLIVINSGIRIENSGLELQPELDTVSVNVSGFIAMANVAVHYFSEKKAGHIVGVSSIAGLRATARSPAYNASKSFISNYMSGLRQRFRGKNIFVTDIRPGFVDTTMIENVKLKFWVATPAKTADQIMLAIQKKKKVVYVTRRWAVIAMVVKVLPEWLYNLIYSRSR
jgi:short-subunit dehydrogenase